MKKATGSYHTYSVLSKTAALVPEFVMEDLPSAELQPRFLHLGRTLMMMMMIYLKEYLSYDRIFTLNLEDDQNLQSYARPMERTML